MAQRAWFRVGIDPEGLRPLGFRSGAGGAHQSKTMMLSELTTLLSAQPRDGETLKRLTISENILGKSSSAARQSVLGQLKKLYGLGGKSTVTAGLIALWAIDPQGRPLLALLCALARDPLLRDSANVILDAPSGDRVGAAEISSRIAALHPERFSPAMLKSLAQNCASSWTQSGHLVGKVKKLRTRAGPTPVVAAYAAFLASLSGFGGPALIASPWLDILDSTINERLSLLRRAEAQGLLNVRAAGEVVEVVLDPLLARVGEGAAVA